MGRFTDDGWESDREPRAAQCEWCEATYDDSGLMRAFAAPLCPDCLDHLCTQCGDAKAVGLDHQFAPMQMCQGCLDEAFAEASEAAESTQPTCEHCGFGQTAHLSICGMGTVLCPTSVWRAR